MVWFKRRNRITSLTSGQKKQDMPAGLWRVCTECQEYMINDEIKRNQHQCPHCNYAYPMPVEDRITITADAGSFTEFDSNLVSKNPLDFDGYDKKMQHAQKKTGRNEGAVTGTATINQNPVILGILDFNFMGGSMGSVVGEKITRAAERALHDEIPFVSISTGGGGARMQEGMLSLMQMAKTSAAVGKLKQQGIPYISIIANPTMGGVAASFVALGDVIIAEPKALIGFAGPRVIEQTIGQQLPEGFQRSEFLLQHGLIDMIVERNKLKDTLIPILNHLWFNQVKKRVNNPQQSSDKIYAVTK